MVQSPSWAATWFAASQEIPRISWNPKVHYRTHKCPPPISILGQPKSIHISTSHLLEIRSNIIQPSTPRSSQWSLSLQFPHQDPINPPLLTHTRHMSSPSHSSLFYPPHNIGWRVQRMYFLRAINSDCQPSVFGQTATFWEIIIKKSLVDRRKLRISGDIAIYIKSVR